MFVDKCLSFVDKCLMIVDNKYSIIVNNARGSGGSENLFPIQKMLAVFEGGGFGSGPAASRRFPMRRTTAALQAAHYISLDVYKVKLSHRFCKSGQGRAANAALAVRGPSGAAFAALLPCA